MKYEELPLINNTADERLELEVEGYTAFITYELDGDTLDLIHTEVPQELGGKGVGGAIVEKAFEFAKQKGYRVIPSCPFVETWLKRHPEWEVLIAR